MSKAKEIYAASEMRRKGIVYEDNELTQNLCNALYEFAKKEAYYTERVELPPGEMDYSPTGKNAFRTYCIFRDDSLLTVLVDCYGNAIKFAAYDKIN